MLKVNFPSNQNKTEMFKTSLALATQRLRVKDFLNAELMYLSILVDLKSHVYDDVNLNDLDIFSLKCCYAYCNIAIDFKSDKGLDLLNSLTQIQTPLIPYLKIGVYISKANFPSAEEQLKYCFTMLDKGYNFKPNPILNCEVIPEIDDNFLKQKLKGITFYWNFFKSHKDPEFNDSFINKWIKVGVYNIDYEKNQVFCNAKSEFLNGFPDVKWTEKPSTKSVYCQTIGIVKKNACIQVSFGDHCVEKQLVAAINEMKSKVEDLDTVKKVRQELSAAHKKLLVNERKMAEFNLVKQLNVDLTQKLECTRKKLTKDVTKMTTELKLIKEQNVDLTQKLESTRQKLTNVATISTELKQTKERNVNLSAKLHTAEQQVILLQMRLVEQVQHKYDIQKGLYCMLEQKLNSKNEYLDEIRPFLYHTTPVTDRECVQEKIKCKQLLKTVLDRRKEFETSQKMFMDHLMRNELKMLKIPSYPDLIPLMSNEFAPDIIYTKFKMMMQRNQLVDDQNPTSSCHSRSDTKSPELSSSSQSSDAAAIDKSEDDECSEDMAATSAVSCPDNKPSTTENLRGRARGNSDNSRLRVKLYRPVRSTSTSCLNSIPSTSVSSRPVSYMDCGPVRCTSISSLNEIPTTNKEVDYEADEKLIASLKAFFPFFSEDTLIETYVQVIDKFGGTVDHLCNDEVMKQMRKLLKPSSFKGKTTKNSYSSTDDDLTFWEQVDIPGSGVPEEDDETTCTICLDEINASHSHKLSCDHEFHKKCIFDWFKQSRVCPICRVPIPGKQGFPQSAGSKK